MKMDASTFYLIAADAVLLLHGLFVVFVVGSFVLIILGKVLSWSWVRNPWFRIAHVAAIGIVMVQSWFGMICPITRLEMALQSQACGAVYSGTFISYWLEKILYYRLPMWLFAVSYSIFGFVVAISWLWVRPRSFRN